MEAKVFIPARFGSTRFPGKPLFKIKNKCMINHVVDNAIEAVGKDNVFACVDSELGYSNNYEVNCQTVLVDELCQSGTDRVFHAVKKLGLLDSNDIIVNLQGDEPLLTSNWIKAVINTKKKNMNCVINMGTTRIKDVTDRSKPKLALNSDYRLMYGSRLPIPSGLQEFRPFLEQVGIYAMTPCELIKFANGYIGNVEKTENIEILRCLENCIPVSVFMCHIDHQAVDNPEDIDKVEEILGR